MENMLDLYARPYDPAEFHYTPKQGSWLNMVEIEFSFNAALSGVILGRKRFCGRGKPSFSCNVDYGSVIVTP